MANNDDDYQSGQKKGNQNLFRLKESAYETLGFSDNMTYEKRAELRKLCSKFIRFSYLVDFIAMESLANIFMNSVKELEDKLSTLSKQNVEVIYRDPTQKGVLLH